MTSTNAMPHVDPPDVKPGGTARERREAKARRRRSLRTVVVVTLVVVLAMGGGGLAWYAAEETADLATQNSTAKQLLATSAGKVAEETARASLSTQIAEAETVLAEPVLSRLLTGTGDARDSLGAASDAVETSMVDFARGQVTAARKGMTSAQAHAEKVHTATEGMGVDDAVRGQLRAALDTLAAVDAAADDALAGADLAELEKAATDLSTNRSALTLATQSLTDAQDAISCPHPDQTWDPDSGKVPRSALAEIPWAPTHKVRADVLQDLVDLDAAYWEAFGVHLTINSSYRTYESQASLYDPAAPTAAPPGCSTHGLGLAVDIGGGVQTFGTQQYDWLKQHAETYGWTHPDWAEPGGRMPEPWHWESVLVRAGS
ncbi:M15 family metallopeptidase [Promicromonospora sp. NPDC060271]|uniref:M15 family metallopeptidase n=1 Tax=Promicromonospora sp. NPDC060271 TaxID=3347089 RepID=UPI0036566300